MTAVCRVCRQLLIGPNVPPVHQLQNREAMEFAILADVARDHVMRHHQGEFAPVLAVAHSLLALASTCFSRPISESDAVRWESLQAGFRAEVVSAVQSLRVDGPPGSGNSPAPEGAA